ncbi:hypothetical protein E2C01_057861 [Portunus trituberculatus]|uniref:Uncharacterized protein n=1 Tax=Portunus trituberculatus TaxID=210409 RepID=A0A5B7H3S7_PORTR|nr:hypothetical protein [Portunus trituberculatus]
MSVIGGSPICTSQVTVVRIPDTRDPKSKALMEGGTERKEYWFTVNSERGGVCRGGGGGAGLAGVIPGVFLPQPLDDQRQNVLPQGRDGDPRRRGGRGSVV